MQDFAGGNSNAITKNSQQKFSFLLFREDLGSVLSHLNFDRYPNPFEYIDSPEDTIKNKLHYINIY